MVYLWLSSVCTGFARGEIEPPAADGHALAFQADQIHFDAMAPRIIGRVMSKGVGVEIRTQLAIGPHHQILVEQAGDAGRIVIGGVQAHRILHQVHADQEPAAIQAGAHLAQQGHGGIGLEIADCRTREKAGAAGDF